MSNRDLIDRVICSVLRARLAAMDERHFCARPHCSHINLSMKLLGQRLHDAGSQARLCGVGRRRHAHAVISDRQGPIQALNCVININVAETFAREGMFQRTDYQFCDDKSEADRDIRFDVVLVDACR